MEWFPDPASSCLGMRFSTNYITYLWYAALGNCEVYSTPSWPTFWSAGDTCASGHYLEKGLLHCAHDLSVWYKPRQLWRMLYASSSRCSWCCFKHRLEENKTACDVHHFFLLPFQVSFKSFSSLFKFTSMSTCISPVCSVLHNRQLHSLDHVANDAILEERVSLPSRFSSQNGLGTRLT